MRDFFKSQLEALYRTCGLQQYAKMSEMPDGANQIKLLLDDLVQVCTWFPLIPEREKERIISEAMLVDQEFIGFNKKFVWKWLNTQNHKYFPDQSRYVESPEVERLPKEVTDKYIDDWKAELAKTNNALTTRADGIKDQRIQQMKDNFGKLECKHITWMYFSDTEEICNDCGAKRQSVTLKNESETP